MTMMAAVRHVPSETLRQGQGIHRPRVGVNTFFTNEQKPTL